MTNITNETWSPSNIQQKVLEAKIERLLNSVEAKKTTISIVSDVEPTQEQWEAEYLRQTRTTPPIPFGVKLVWIDTRDNTTKYYATTLDNNGVFSTGTIYELVNTEEKYLPIRYLGHGTELFIGAFLKSVHTQFKPHEDNDTDVNTLFINPKKFAEQGLEAILIFFRGVTDMNITGDNVDPESSDTRISGQVGVSQVQVEHNGTAQTITEQRATSWANHAFTFANGNAFGDYAHQGVIFINNLSELVDGSGSFDETYSGITGWAMSVNTTGNVSVAGNMEGRFTVFNGLDTKKYIVEGLLHSFQRGQYHVYGIYNKKTANNLAEGKNYYALR